MLNLFKIIGILEGISYILLFFNMIIIKNIDDIFYKNLVTPIGLAHGLLYIGYMVLAIMLKIDRKWSINRFILISIAALVPFGTFYSEKHWLNNKM